MSGKELSATRGEDFVSTVLGKYGVAVQTCRSVRDWPALHRRVLGLVPCDTSMLMSSSICVVITDEGIFGVQVRGAIVALKSVGDLRRPSHTAWRNGMDLLDWLGCWFGFQVRIWNLSCLTHAWKSKTCHELFFLFRVKLNPA